MKNTYTIFGKGFVGANISNFLLKKKYKVFLAPKNKYKFNTNLYNVIYCNKQTYLELGCINFIYIFLCIICNWIILIRKRRIKFLKKSKSK